MIDLGEDEDIMENIGIEDGVAKKNDEIQTKIDEGVTKKTDDIQNKIDLLEKQIAEEEKQ